MLSSHSPVPMDVQAGGYTTALKGGDSVAMNSGGRSGGGARHRPGQGQQKSLAHALLPDLPLLMHGSGDVLPEEVDPRSVATLAKLIEKYVASLVGAAMDAHDVFTDGEVVGGGACLPPPPFGASAGGVGEDEDGGHRSNRPRVRGRRRKRRKIDYWDDPLPPAAEDNEGHSDDISDDLSSDSDDDAPLLVRRMSSSASAASVGSTGSLDKDVAASVQSLMPLDLHSSSRTRGFYVSAPTVMDARSFIFPVCHDAVLYQRIKEVQASRRALQRDVLDETLMEVMKEEGGVIGRWGAVDMLDAVLGGASVSNNEAINNSVRSPSSAESKNKEGKSEENGGGEKKKKKKDGKSDPEKKDVSGTNHVLVGAGLLDPDVDPSWPGLDALARGRLW